jgi:hypothetical protein
VAFSVRSSSSVSRKTEPRDDPFQNFPNQPPTKTPGTDHFMTPFRRPSLTTSLVVGQIKHTWPAELCRNEVKQGLEASLKKGGRKRTDFDLNMGVGRGRYGSQTRSRTHSPAIAFDAAFTPYQKY